MNEREISNPHDQAFICFDDPEAACAAVLIVGRGAYGIVGDDGMPIFLFGGFDGWWEERFGHAFSREQIPAARLKAALLSMRLTGRRSSITDFVGWAHEYAGQLA